MAKRAEGNGSPKVPGKIDIQNRGQGYIVFHPGPHNTPEDELPIVFSRAIQEFLKKFPNLRVRTALPLTKNGNTVAVHLWCDDSETQGQTPQGT